MDSQTFRPFYFSDEKNYLSIFRCCSEPDCGKDIPEANLGVSIVGAGLKLKGVCTKGHVTSWQSAEFFNQVKTII